MLNSKKTKKLTFIYAPHALLELIFEAYYFYKSQPVSNDADIQYVVRYHYFFSLLVKQTGTLIDEYEFRRRLYSNNPNLNVIESLDDKIISTSEWLSKQEEANAYLAENVLHNLFYVLKLHKFSPEAKPIFDKIEAFFLEKNKI
jgi:hypothetical protein